MYIVIGGTPAVSIDLQVLGSNEEVITSPGRTVTHELNDGTYLTRGLGHGVETINISGEFTHLNILAGAQLAQLRKLSGSRCEFRLGQVLKFHGIIKSVNPTKQERVGEVFPVTSWRLDVNIEDSGVDSSDYE